MNLREVGDADEVGGPWKGQSRVHGVAVTRVSEARGMQRKAAGGPRWPDGDGNDDDEGGTGGPMWPEVARGMRVMR